MTRFLSALWLITALLPAEPDSAALSKDDSAVLREFMETPGRAIPQDLLDRAECAVIVPGVKKAALLIGARYGKGYISCRNPAGMGWTAPGTVRIEGGSVGFQNGGSEMDAQLTAQILSWPRSHGAFAGARTWMRIAICMASASPIAISSQEHSCAGGCQGTGVPAEQYSTRQTH